MRFVDIIEKKRDGNALTTEEIQFFITNYTNGTIPDYQVSALLMAIYYQGMTSKECADLTSAMMYSGDMVDLSSINGIELTVAVTSRSEYNFLSAGVKLPDCPITATPFSFT